MLPLFDSVRVQMNPEGPVLRKIPKGICSIVESRFSIQCPRADVSRRFGPIVMCPFKSIQ